MTLKIYDADSYLSLDLEKTFGVSSIIKRLNSMGDDDKNLNRSRIIMTILMNTTKDNKEAAIVIYSYFKELVELNNKM